MAHSNEAWLALLRSAGLTQQTALSELREKLLRGLRGALAVPAQIDDAFLEDAVQDSLIRILDRLDQFQGRSRFLTWATSIAIRVAMNEIRRRRWKNVSLSEVLAKSGPGSEPAAAGEGPDVKWEQQAIIQKVHELIENELTEKQQTAILAELKGMPQEEIARHIGSNRNAVYKLTHDARKCLKRAMEASGYHAADILAAFDGSRS